MLNMRIGYFPSLRRFPAKIALAFCILLLVFTTRSGLPGRPHQPTWLRRHSLPKPPPTTLPEAETLGLLKAYSAANESEFCTDRFGPQYLYDIRDHAFQYCSGPPSSGGTSLTCFHSHAAVDRVDSLCVAQGALLDPSRTFTLNCDVRTPDSDESAQGLIHYDQIAKYWYNTGAKYVLENFLRLKKGDPSPPTSPAVSNTVPTDRPPFAILVKREGEGNVWHCLMEIWSLTHTLDVLRLSGDPARRGASIYDPARDDAQVIILDEHNNGPFWPLWRLLTGREPIRLADAMGSPALSSPLNLVVPLAGGSNPMWQNDWEDRDCRDAPLLKVFVRRVIAHLGIEPFEPMALQPRQHQRQLQAGRGGEHGQKLRLTFINRTSTRRILGNDALLDAARRRFENDLDIRSVDFGPDMLFSEQIRIIRETDILVGAHGAGLTHAMFLRGVWDGGRGSAVVEIQPSGLYHKGFRNLAMMLGHEYFVTHASMTGESFEGSGESEQKADGATSGEQSEAEERIEGDGKEEGEDTQNPKPTSGKNKEQYGQSTSKLLKRRGLLAKRDEWHSANIRIGEIEFLEIIGHAVESLKSGVDSHN